LTRRTHVELFCVSSCVDGHVDFSSSSDDEPKFEAMEKK